MTNKSIKSIVIPIKGKRKVKISSMQKKTGLDVLVYLKDNRLAIQETVRQLIRKGDQMTVS